MSRHIRKATTFQADRLKHALSLLKGALDMATQADCPSLRRKIRSAIKSAGGAERHMRHRLLRAGRTWRESL